MLLLNKKVYYSELQYLKRKGYIVVGNNIIFARIRKEGFAYCNIWQEDNIIALTLLASLASKPNIALKGKNSKRKGSNHAS